MPQISVVIPVHNGAGTIAETIASVLGQSFTDIEVMVMNDGSTDSTLEKVNAFVDSRVRVFTHPKSGSNYSRNRGVEVSTGAYLSFIDADDIWTSDKLEAQLQALETNPQAAVAYSWTDRIDMQGKFLRTSSHATFSGNVLPHLMLSNFIASGSNLLIRRQALLDVGQFDPNLRNAQDWDLALRLAACYEFVCVQKVQILYRFVENSLSSNIGDMEQSCLKIIERSFSQAPASLQILKPHSLGNCYKYLAFKVLTASPTNQRPDLARRYLRRAIHYDPSLLKMRSMWRVVLKLICICLLPQVVSVQMLVRFQSVFSLNGLLAKIYDNPSQFGLS